MKQLFLSLGIFLCLQSIICLASSASMVTITNTINPAELKKFGQIPEFNIYIDGALIAPGHTCKVSADAKVVIRYEYSFLKGMYRGTNDITFSFNDPNKKDYDLSFSWKKEHEPWRVIMSGAKVLSKKKIS